PDPSRSPPSRDSMPFRHSGAPAPPGPPCGTADRGALPADTRSPAEPPPPSCSAPLLPPARIQPPARTPSDSSLSAPFRPPLVRTPNLEGAASIRHSRGDYRPSTTPSRPREWLLHPLWISIPSAGHPPQLARD